MIQFERKYQKLIGKNIIDIFMIDLLAFTLVEVTRRHWQSLNIPINNSYLTPWLYYTLTTSYVCLQSCFERHLILPMHEMSKWLRSPINDSSLSEVTVNEINC